MGQLDKAKRRLKERPRRNYSWGEAEKLLLGLGFRKVQRAGSRVCFIDPVSKRKILLHRPHPDPDMDPAAVRELADFLEGLEFL